MKLLYVILDGLGDSRYEKLNNKTPLEYAKTPNLDRLAKNGINGVMYPVKEGIAPESDQAMLSLLGYDPFKVFTGRGILEAYGANVPLKKGDLVLRVNFVRLIGGEIESIEPKISVPRVKRLVSFLNSNIKFKDKLEARLYHTVGHRGVLIFRGKKLSANISNSHPGYKIIEKNITFAQKIAGRELKIRKIRALDNKENSEYTAAVLNAYLKKVQELLKTHSINAIITRGASKKLPKLERLKGNWLLLVDTPIDIAVGKLTGMNYVKKPEGYKETADIIIKNQDKYDNFYLQIKGPDFYAHHGNVMKKVKSIEQIDKEFFEYLSKKLKNFKICVTADHSTECRLMAHSPLPVPVLIYDGENKDDVDTFSEDSRNGKLGTLNSGRELFERLF